MGTLRLPGSYPSIRGGVFNPGLGQPLVVDETVWYEASARNGALDASQPGEHPETAIVVREIRATQLQKQIRKAHSKERTFRRKKNQLLDELAALYDWGLKPTPPKAKGETP